MIYCFDLDGTLCTHEIDYRRASPIPERVERVRSLKDEGHEVVICTARGAVTGQDWREITEGQLDEWGVPYDRLSFRKEHADVYVDDKARTLEFFE